MTMIRSPPPPQWECNARLEGSCSRTCSSCGGGSSSIDFDGSSGSTSGENDSAAAVVWNQLICRMMHHRLAIDQVSDDGEAWHYSGMALYDYHLHIDSLRQRQQTRHQQLSSADWDDSGSLFKYEQHDALELAVSCLEEAAKHTPCDGRLYNNLGIALERLLERYNTANNNNSNNNNNNDDDNGSTPHDNSAMMMTVELNERIRTAYETSTAIHSACQRVGCDVAADFESACLNRGLYLSKLDEFGAAVEVLSRMTVQPAYDDGDAADNAADNVDGDAAGAWARRRVVEDAMRLLSFCQKQL